METAAIVLKAPTAGFANLRIDDNSISTYDTSGSGNSFGILEKELYSSPQSLKRNNIHSSRVLYRQYPSPGEVLDLYTIDAVNDQIFASDNISAP